MAKKKKSSKRKAVGILHKIFKASPTCSRAGSTLAKDKSPKKKLKKAGSTLGSLTCKAPAKARKSAMSKRGKAGVVKRKKK